MSASLLRAYRLGRRLPLARRHSTAPSELELTRHAGADAGIVTLSLNRPAAKNALSRALVASLAQALDTLHDDRTVRALVLRSSVPRVFCAGADLKERARMSAAEIEQFLGGVRRAFGALERLPVPTIAALDGAALGGGLEMALCCDLRVAGPGARLGLPETALAIIPGAGGTQRLARLVGASRAKALVFTARRLDARQALDAGVVNDAADGDGEPAYARALQWAREIAGNGPVAVRMAKRAIDLAAAAPAAAGLDVEQLCYAQVVPTQDRLEGLRAFAEKRRPVYEGR
ncbi:hypothetical protein H4S02_004645 [Coemansia sp. RSA 2611]|nr:hypothetical protein H4S02_004645 [Coemansia sp. RSA 2611]